MPHTQSAQPGCPGLAGSRGLLQVGGAPLLPRVGDASIGCFVGGSFIQQGARQGRGIEVRSGSPASRGLTGGEQGQSWHGHHRSPLQTRALLCAR